MKGAVACLLLLAVSASAFHIDFDSLTGWEHSSDAKYTGKFALETPAGLSKPALKASRPRAITSPPLCRVVIGLPRPPIDQA